MSVPKNKRTVSDVIYFNHAYDLVEKLTKYLLSDFGITKTYRDLIVFTNKAKMDLADKASFEDLVNRYHLNIEASYPEWLICHYRDNMLNIMDSLIRNISRAHTMYPNSMYEFNVKRQYQTDAISDCFDLKHTLQLAIAIFTSNNLEKYIPFIRLIDEEIGYLKAWRKECNKFKKVCSDNDARTRAVSEKKIEAESTKKNKDMNFLERVLQCTLSRKMLIDNISNTSYYYGSDGRLYSSSLVPAMIIYTDEKMSTIKSIGID